MSKTLEQLEAELKVIDDAIETLDAKIAPLEKLRNSRYLAKERLKNSIRELRKTDLQAMLVDPNAFMELSALLPKNLRTFGYQAIDGDYSNPEQIIEVKLEYKEAVSDELIEFIEKRWLPITKIKSLGVLRYDLKEDHDYVIYEDAGEWKIHDARYDRRRTRPADFKGTLREVLEYVAEFHHSNCLEDEYDSEY